MSYAIELDEAGPAAEQTEYVSTLRRGLMGSFGCFAVTLYGRDIKKKAEGMR